MLKTVESVDVLADQGLQRRLVRESLVVCAVGAVASVLWAASGLPLGRWGEDPLALAVAVLVGSVAALPVHELVHGAAFKLLGPRGTRLCFGYQDGMLFCGSPGTVLGRRRILVVLLAPAVLLSAAFAGLGVLWDAPFVAFLCTWIHLAGCSGDTLMAERVLGCPEADLVRDTQTGIDLLRSMPDGR